MRTSAAILFGGLILLSGCGTGACLNQAACPDGSWSLPDYSFADFMASTLHRDRAAPQKTLKEELELGPAALPSGYRNVPKIGNEVIPTAGDDDGSVGGSVTYGSRPVTVCGTTQTSVDARVEDCAAKNSVMATWDGSVSGNAAQGKWRLVTYNGTHEVWRDERTGLLWSDRLGQTNWCRAAGSSGAGPYGEPDQYGYCDSVTYQPVQATPESWCVEDAAFITPALYDSMKGGMRLSASATSPSIIWRLPSKWDYLQAELDGIRFPLPNMSDNFWSSTVFASIRNYAWKFISNGGGSFDADFRSEGTIWVRCVGR